MLEDAEARGECLLDAVDALPDPRNEMTGHELMQLCHCKAFNKIRKTLSNVQKLTCAPLAAEGGEREGHNYQPSPYPAQYYPYSPYTLWFQYTLCKEEGLFCYLFTNNWSQNDFGQYYLFDNLVDAGEESEDGGLLALALLGQLGAKPAPFFPTSLINYRKRRSSVDDTDESCDPTKEVCPGNRRRRDAECDSDVEDCSGNRRRCETDDVNCDPAECDSDVEDCSGNRRRRETDDVNCDPADKDCPGNRRRRGTDAEKCDPAVRDCSGNRRRRGAEKPCELTEEGCPGTRRRRASEKPCDPAVEDCSGNRRRRGAEKPCELT